jgi:hypothetical protein
MCAGFTGTLLNDHIPSSLLRVLLRLQISDVAAIQAAGLDTAAVAKRATESYLIQILKHGFFHADQHPVRAWL